jgi:hypothetical protein
MRVEAPEDPSQEESGTEGPNEVNEGPGACEGVAAGGSPYGRLQAAQRRRGTHGLTEPDKPKGPGRCYVRGVAVSGLRLLLCRRMPPRPRMPVPFGGWSYPRRFGRLKDW